MTLKSPVFFEKQVAEITKIWLSKVARSKKPFRRLKVVFEMCWTKIKCPSGVQAKFDFIKLEHQYTTAKSIRYHLILVESPVQIVNLNNESVMFHSPLLH